METKNIVNRMLEGDCKDLPDTRAKQVRIFLSSTFTDTHEERDYLIEFIYPKLHEYCKKEYNLDFQVIDLRWGIPSDYSDINHSTTNICLKEIQECQKNSLGPNFVCLLSHKYGNRFLPSTLEFNEYQIINNEINTHLNEYKDLLSYENIELNLRIDNLFKYCYRKDENVHPNVYQLLPLSFLIHNFNVKEDRDKNAWLDIQTRLFNLLVKSSKKCNEKGFLTEEQTFKFYTSITEQEIASGILSASKRNSNCLCFIRDIEDIENVANKEDKSDEELKLLKRFIDFDQNNQIDRESRDRLNQLKKKIMNNLAEDNVFTFKSVKWFTEKGVTRTTNFKYIQEFGETFYEAVKKLVDKNAHEEYFLDKVEENDRLLIKEVFEHAKLAAKMKNSELDNGEIINKMVEYINSDNQVPFFVYGETGCGKTSFIASLGYEAKNLYQNAKILLRFLGTTPGTSNLFNLYKSLIHQLSIIFNLNLPDNIFKISEAKDYLMRIITELQKEKFIILLDSLDQLFNDKHDIENIIIALPKNVKIIYSISSSTNENLLGQFKSLLLGKGKQFLAFQMQPINQNQALILVREQLSKNNRNLASHQWEHLNKLFSKVIIYPLYIKLIVNFISSWSSFFEPNDQFHLNITIDKCIEYLFQTLERTHSHMLFSRCMFYLNSFKNGISENELEDVLSIDDDVLYNLFQFHHPPMRRFPVALWARIKNDLSDYIVEKEIYDTPVINWYHRSFKDVVDRLYIQSTNETQQDLIITNIIEYFNETWREKAKPYTVNDYLIKKLKLKSKHCEAVRFTSIQKIKLTNHLGQINYNKRKLTELPWIITKLSSHEALNLYSEHILFNYEFFSGQIACLSTNEILANLSRLDTKLRQIPKYEIKLIKSIYFDCLQACVENPNCLAIQILSRLLDHNGGKYPLISKFIQECDENSFESNALVAMYQYVPEPKIDTQFSLRKHTRIISSIILCDSHLSLIISMSADKINISHFSVSFGIESLGDIILPPTDDKYKDLQVYLNKYPDEQNLKLSLFDGFLIVSTNSVLRVISFEGIVLSELRIMDDILDYIIQIDSNQLLITLKTYSEYYLSNYKNYFSVYSFENDNINEASRHEFTNTIKFIDTNLKYTRINLKKDFDHVQLFIILDTHEIHILQKRTNGKFSTQAVIPAPGIDFLSSNFFTKMNSLIVLYKAGLCGIYNIKDFNDIKISLVHSKETFDLFSSKPIDYVQDDDGDVCILIKYHLNLFLLKNGYFSKIGDDCFNGKFITNKLVCTTRSKSGFVDIYRFTHNFDDSSSTLNIVKLKEIQLHSERVSHLLLRDDWLISASENGNIKIISLKELTTINEEKSKFDYVDYLIKDEKINMVQVAGDLFATYQSKRVDLWNIKTGRISKTKHFSFEIDTIIASNEVVYILGKNKETKNIIFEVYTVDPFERIFEKRYQQLKSIYKLSFNRLYKKIYGIYSETGSDLSIQSYTITSEKQLQKHSTVKIEKSKQDTFVFSDKLQNVFFTSLSSILVIYHKNELFFYENPPKLNFKKYIENLASTGAQFVPLEGTDSFVSLNSFNQLILIEYSGEIKLTTIADNVYDYMVNKTTLAVLLRQPVNSLAVYTINESGVASCKMVLPIQVSIMYSLSSDNNYIAIIEHEKNLSLYRISDQKLIAYKTSCYDIYKMQVTQDYVILVINGRLLSFLIVDSTIIHHQDRIKQLPSRQIINSNSIEKDDLIRSNTDDGDNQLDSQEIHDDELFDIVFKSKARHYTERMSIVEKLKNQVKKMDLRKMVSLEFDFDSIKEKKFWLLSMVIENSWLNEDKLNELRQPVRAKNCSLIELDRYLYHNGLIKNILQFNEEKIINLIKHDNYYIILTQFKLRVAQFKSNSLKIRSELNLPGIPDTYKNVILFQKNSTKLKLAFLLQSKNSLSLCIQDEFKTINLPTEIDYVLPLDNSHLIIKYENSNFIDIYQINNLAFLETRRFLSQVISIHVDQEKYRVYVTLANSEINIFQFSIIEPILVEILKVPQNGIDCSTCKIYSNQLRKVFVMSLINGNVVVYYIYDHTPNEVNLILLKTSLNSTGILVSSDYDFTKDRILLINDKHDLYLHQDCNLYEIGSIYNDAKFSNDNRIFAFNYGIIDIYAYHLDPQRTIKIVKLHECHIHYDRIIYYECEANMMITASLDGSIRKSDLISFIPPDNKKNKLKSHCNIDFMLPLSNSSFVTGSNKELSFIDIKDWQKTASSFFDKVISISEVKLYDHLLICVGQNQDCSILLAFKDNNLLLNREFPLKTIESNLLCQDDKVIFLTKSISHYELVSIDLDENKDLVINVSNLTDSNLPNDTITLFCITHANLIAIFIINQTELVFFDLKKETILKRRSLRDINVPIEYLQPLQLECINDTDDILVLNKSNKLIYFIYKDTSKKFKIDFISDRLKDDNLKIVKLVVNKNNVCFLSDTTKEIYFLNDIKHLFYRNYLFRLKFNECHSLDFTIDSNSQFLTVLENQFLISLFTIHDTGCKFIKKFNLHCPYEHVIVTNEFICAFLKNQTFIRYLIVDSFTQSIDERQMSLSKDDLIDKIKIMKRIYENDNFVQEILSNCDYLNENDGEKLKEINRLKSYMKDKNLIDCGVDFLKISLNDITDNWLQKRPPKLRTTFKAIVKVKTSSKACSIM